ncbi:MAG: RyR domain-containing protein [Candidatus Nitrotoga sp.]
MAEDGMTLVEHVARQVAAYDEIRPVYEVFAKVLSEILSYAVKDLGVTAIVQARAKDKASFAEKSARKRNTYPDAVNQLTDLCGGRIIVDCKDDIEPIRNFICEHFEITEEEDVFERLKTTEFGYRSVHFIVSLKRGELESILESLCKRQGSLEKQASFRTIVERLFERHAPAHQGEQSAFRGPKFKAEIQVRTLLQHAWAAIGHDRIYKSEFAVPKRWQRDAIRIAAYLEEADEAFSRTVKGVEGYRNYYGAYMSRKQQEEELERLEAVSRYDTENMPLAHKIARLALSLRHWKLAENKLKPFVETWDSNEAASPTRKASTLHSNHGPNEAELAGIIPKSLRATEMAAVLLDYGQAIWGRTKLAGCEYMERAFNLNPTNADACVAMAEADLEQNATDTALKWFEQAFRISPEEPRALAGFIFCKLAIERDLNSLPLIRPSLEAAVERCRERARVKVYLPWAYYDAGLFLLLLGKPYESLTSYVRAVCLSESEDAISKPMDWIQRLHESLGDKLPEIDWVRRLLILAKVGKLLNCASDADSSYQISCQTLKIADSELAKLTCVAYAEQDQKKIQLATDAKDKATAEVNRARQFADSCRSDTHNQINKYLTPLKSSNVPLFEAPVILVAGGTDKNVEQKMRDYQPLLETAFEDFRGTVFSGGTTAGISGIIGDLPDSTSGPIRKISCLPVAVPTGIKSHPRYEVYTSTGNVFSALEVIQTWIDLMARAIVPADVKILGINGGKITAFEFRLGLMLGATVGVLRDSGRAASALVEDEDWKDSPALLLLPTDPQTVKTFVQGIPSAKVLDQSHREALAKDAHEAYRINQKKRHIGRELAMGEWEELPFDIKNSNINQIDHIEEKLRIMGMQLRKCPQEQVRLIEFSANEIERMSESEHGRWNLDRLRAGWSLGERNLEAKKSPYLVPWLELPDEVKEWDRQAVTALPKMLKEFGYEIVRPHLRQG